MCLFRKGGTIQSQLLSSSSPKNQMQGSYVDKEMVEQSNTDNTIQSIQEDLNHTLGLT